MDDKIPNKVKRSYIKHITNGVQKNSMLKTLNTRLCPYISVNDTFEFLWHILFCVIDLDEV